GLCQIDDWPLVDGPAPEQGLPGLIETDAPAEGTIILALHPQDVSALFEHARAQVRAVAHEAKHARHQRPPSRCEVSGVPLRARPPMGVASLVILANELFAILVRRTITICFELCARVSSPTQKILW